jgi:filamentous hemagglutinin
MQIVTDGGSFDLNLGGALAGIIATAVSYVTGIIAIGTDTSTFSGANSSFYGIGAGKEATDVSDTVYVGNNAGKKGLGDTSVVIGSSSAPIAVKGGLSGNSIVVGASALPNATYVERTTVIGRRSGLGAVSVTNAVVIGDELQLASTCDEVVAIGSGLTVRSPATRITALGHFSTVGGSNTIAIGWSNETGTGSAGNVVLGTSCILRGDNNIVIARGLNAMDASCSNNIILGGGYSLGAVSGTTALDAGAYPGGVTTSNMLYLGGCLRWSKMSGELVLRGTGTATLLVTNVAAVTATPTLLSLFGNVTVTPAGVLTAPVISSPTFSATILTAGTLTASGLVTANAGLTVNNVVLIAQAGSKTTTLEATDLVQAKAGMTVTGAVLDARSGAKSTTLEATGLVQAKDGVTVTGAILDAQAGSRTTVLEASGLVQAKAGVTVTGAIMDAQAGAKVTTLEATGLVQAKAGLTVTTALMDAQAGAKATTLEATGLVQAKAGVTVSGAILDAQAGTKTTSLEATGIAQAKAGLTVTGAFLDAQAGAKATTVEATGLVQAKGGVTVTGDILDAQAGAKATTLEATGLIQANAGLTVTGGIVDARAGSKTTVIEATGLVQAKAGLTVTGALLDAQAGSKTTTLEANGLIQAKSGITVTSALMDAQAGAKTTTLEANGMVQANAGLTVTAVILDAQAGAKTTTLEATSTSTLAVVNAGSTTASSLEVTNNARVKGVLTVDHAIAADGGMTVTDLTSTGTFTASGTFDAIGTVTAKRLVASDPPIDPLALPPTYLPGYGLTTTSLQSTTFADMGTIKASGAVTANAGLLVDNALLKACAGTETTTLTASASVSVSGSAGLTTTKLEASDVALLKEVTASGLLSANGGVKALLNTEVQTLDVKDSATMVDVKATGLMSLGAGLTVTSGLTALQGLEVGGDTSLKMLTVTGAASFASSAGQSVPTLTVDGSATPTEPALSVSGKATVSSLEVTDATATYAVDAPSVRATNMTATTINATGVTTVDTLVVVDASYDKDKPAPAIRTTTLSATKDISSYNIKTNVDPTDTTYGVYTQKLYATAVDVTSLSAGIGSISTTGTVSAGTVSVSSWNVVQYNSDLRFASGTKITEVRDTYQPLDGPGRVYALRTGPAVEVGMLMSATGEYSTATSSGSTAFASVDVAVPVVTQSTLAASNRYVGVVAAIESSASERVYPFGTLAFRVPTSDVRLVLNVSGFGAVLVDGSGGDISIGDLLTLSSSAGVAARQADDIVRSSTIGKATSDLVIKPKDPAVLLGCKYI